MNWIKKIFNNNLNYFRFKASVLSFVIINFLFFLNYYFIWANFYYNITIKLFPYLYFLVLISYLFLFIFTIKYKFPNINKLIFVVIILFLLLILALFSIFIVFGSDFLNFIK